MLHLTIFGSGVGELPMSGCTALTLFGSTRLRRPTLAQRIAHRRGGGGRRPRRWRRFLGLDQSVLINFFGSTMIEAPTLVEEYAALRELVGGSGIDAEEVRALAEQLLAENDRHRAYQSITLFGSCLERRPSAKRERAALEAGAAGLSSWAHERLEALVGLGEEPAMKGVLQAACAAG